MLTRRRVYGVNEYVIRGVSSTELINLYDLKPTATAEPNFQDGPGSRPQTASDSEVE
ncbi:unnamed protein product, partial [Effrenium voratum]